MKIIFLDIDGVLNSLRSCMAHKGYPHPNREHHKFDVVAIKLLQRIAEETGAKIVLSSSWRISMGLNEKYKLQRALVLDIFDVTPFLNKKRGYEIQAILEKHQPTHYAILDDSSDMLEHQLNNFVKVDFNNGLSYENYRRALGLLGHKQGDIIVVEED